MPSKMKQIGWVAQHRKTPKHIWRTKIYNTSQFKNGIIGNISDYEDKRRKGLVRCVPVYVEVTDG